MINRHHNSGSNSRPRSYTDQSEDTLTPAEKQELLNSFPSDMQFHEDERHHHSDNELDLIQMDDIDKNDEEEVEEEDRPRKKKRRLNNSNKEHQHGHNNTTATSTTATIKNLTPQQKLVEKAKSKLSKWTKRLFDPNRPRGLVEAPTVIPLNDEFLQNFGIREKKLDDAIGRDIYIHAENLDDAIMTLKNDEVNKNEEQQKHLQSKKNNKEVIAGEDKIKQEEEEEAKVKISNLAYTTSKQKLTQTCERYGPVVQVTLIMDENNEHLSKGRAYVVFETMEGRESFIQNMNEKSLDGRIIRIAAVANDQQKRRKNRDSFGGGSGGSSSLARYWEKDITTKCFRCGQIGHMSSNCPNEELQKPCPLCAKTGHDSYSCPLSKICFNCGVPGHLNKECPERRGMPRRLVCGICFMSGHHRWNCRERRDTIPSFNAQCFLCEQTGHFMCSPMRWFFGLRGITCFNCGESGHHGSECARPIVDDCARNAEIVLNELDRAGAASLAQELEEAKRTRRNSGRKDSDGSGAHQSSRRDIDSSNNGHRSRAKSQPPPRKMRMDEQSSTYGRISMDKRSADKDGDRNRR